MIGDRELIHNVRIAKLRLKSAKENEMRWRMLAAMQLFPNPTLGTNSYNDGEVKLVCKESYTLDKRATVVTDRIAELWAKFPEDHNALRCLLEWKPALIKPSYDVLSEAARTAFGAVLTIKSGTPSLTLGGEADE